MLTDVFIYIENYISLVSTHKTIKKVVFKWLKLVMHVCDQSLDGQIDTLEEYGCERIFSEKASGRKKKNGT